MELADASLRAVVFAGGERTRALNLALAQDLAGRGARVVLVVPEGAAEGEGVLPLAVGEAPAELLPILEIMPVHLLAFPLAAARGVTPGEFRYGAKVQSRE